ncbi:acidic proline-rich protein PRP33-like [Tribolium madens]|uniref:acidic proline-rich protein PRP33-like n=1 Tax=Tribolium madens TaxID=41895 RepID=UPI001CF72D16|nr:acidic proline-rich protein PRP33-like [Tribolium madens]
MIYNIICAFGCDSTKMKYFAVVLVGLVVVLAIEGKAQWGPPNGHPRGPPPPGHPPHGPPPRGPPPGQSPSESTTASTTETITEATS